MGTTPNYTWPYPELTDPPDGATQIKSLANAVDGTVKGIDTRVIGHDNPAICQVRQTIAQSIATGVTNAALLFDTEDFDTANMWSTAAKDRLICTKAGIFEVFGSVSFNAQATGRRGGFWAKNGTNLTQAASFYQATASSLGSFAMPTCLVRLAVNEYIQLNAYQDCGVALNTGSVATTQSFAGLRYVGP